jgi:phage host-nuclease inhibitor protein Gam
MVKVATPRSLKAASSLLERYAELQSQIDLTDADRASSIADVNARCDAATAAPLEERAAIRTALELWWGDKGEALTEAKRKSIELGGCMIGSRAGRASLDVAGNEQAILKSLQRRKWAQDLLRVKATLDRPAILKALGGAYRKQLAALGLRRKEGEETFFIERAEQAGTLAGAE